MAAGELSTRVGRQGGMAHDELAQLALDFDAMAERIEALVAHDRSVLQDLSHELRSPLARLHLILDLAQRSTTPAEADSYFRQAEQEIGRLDRMTGEMLALSRLEGGIPGMSREQLELVELAHGCMAQAELEADARNVRLSLTSSKPVTVFGSALLLERALDNLIANAIKFSPEGGTWSCLWMQGRMDSRNSPSAIAAPAYPMPNWSFCSGRSSAAATPRARTVMAWDWPSCSAWCRCMAATSTREMPKVAAWRCICDCRSRHQ
jgi:hypothetical protein